MQQQLAGEFSISNPHLNGNKTIKFFNLRSCACHVVHGMLPLGEGRGVGCFPMSLVSRQARVEKQGEIPGVSRQIPGPVRW